MSAFPSLALLLSLISSQFTSMQGKVAQQRSFPKRRHCESSFQHSHIKKVNEVTLEAILMLSRPKLVVS
ncbi:hypothetical protein QQP08_005224 [Theobroma cacao]|nr:hypothetical protein QQP08_005224 [Theobroma cacao]